MRRLRSARLFLFVVAIAAVRLPVIAQSAAPATANWARVQSLASGTTIQIATTGHSLRSMTIVSVDRAGLTLRDPAAPAAADSNYVAKDDVLEVRGTVPGHRGSKKGLVIGTAVGGGIGALGAMAPRLSGDNVSAGSAVAFVSVYAAIGGTIGYFVSHSPKQQGVIYAKPRWP